MAINFLFEHRNESKGKNLKKYDTHRHTCHPFEKSRFYIYSGAILSCLHKKYFLHDNTGWVPFYTHLHLKLQGLAESVERLTEEQKSRVRFPWPDQHSGS